MAIFLQALNYLVDAYLMFAASAIAGNTFLRSIAGAAFPLFARQMFDGMGIQWAGTLLGCVALVLSPIPFIFYYHGHQIRQKSNYAPTPEPMRSTSDQSSGETAIEKEDVAAMASAPRRSDDANGAKQTV